MSKVLLRVCSLGALCLSVACGPSVSSGDDDDTGADASTDPCSPGETRCSGNSYQECVDGLYEEQELCLGTQVCDPQLQCVDCRPSSGDTCVGTEVHTCNSDGTIGALVEDCGDQMCTGGQCGDDGCGAGAELIYVVDDSNHLFSFDPEKLPPDQPFTQVGTLNCSAGTPLDGSLGAATPFSMSVDRSARAWVLYSSGEIFWVDTQNATSCQNSGFVKQQNNFDLFGMGFVSDSPGSNDETLFVAGGSVTATGAGKLGTIDADSLVLSPIQDLPTAEYNPELTGTGDAELYGYWPSASGADKVTHISKSDASNLQTWALAAACTDLLCQVRAWAFAFWGGKFYIFITTNDGFTDTAKVVLLDPSNGNNSVISGLDNTGHIIVGAGVSTCAPVYVP